MMATSETFKDIYVCELSYWQQGMPLEMYDQMLELYKIKPFPRTLEKVHIEKRVSRDIDDVGRDGIDIVKDIGITLEAPVEKCILCHKCEKECPEDAVIIIEREGKRFANISSQNCLGTSCKRCVAICPEQTMNHSILKIKR
jgi:methylamine methyltransferase corrinoid activation protein